MASLLHLKNSPYYYARIYDSKYIKKYRSICTKIPITKEDLKRIKEVEILKEKSPDKKFKIKLVGNKETKLFLKSLERGLEDNNILKSIGINLTKSVTFEQGYNEYISAKSRIGDPNAIKPKTIESYKLAKTKFINACGNKRIDEYTNKKDFTELLKYFNETNQSDNSKGIYTRSLRAMWNYFIKEKYTTTNIIEKIIPENSIPAQAIPDKELKLILDYFKAWNIKYYYVIKYLVLTGCRPSSMIEQKRNLIFIDKNYMLIRNVKARKHNKYYPFPLYKNLKNLIVEIKGKYPENEDSLLFNYLSEPKHAYCDSLWFWHNAMKELLENKTIKQRYQLKQLRKTFISYSINNLGMPLYLAQKLADHSDSRITETNYLDLDMVQLKKSLDRSSLCA